MTKLIIQGLNGRMGKALYTMIKERDDCKIVAGVDIKTELNVPTFETLAQVNIDADVLIDFSYCTATMQSLKAIKEKKLRCVICTTGFNEEQLAQINELSSHVAVFRSANMSLGINVLIELARKANTVLGTAYDIEIIEKHHHNKLDSPSGTAIMIADAINENADNMYNYIFDRSNVRKARETTEIGIHAVRGGSIVGEHDVLFCGANEVITLSHSAASREVFADGAVSAALFIADKNPGMYNMKDLIG